MTISGWIGVDLDGVLAKYEGWDNGQIGEPIPEMVRKVHQKLAEGVTIKIFTARVCVNDKFSIESQQTATWQFAKEQTRLIQEWCLKHLGIVLEVTNEKDFTCIEIWDDRAKQVIMNTGMFVGE